METQGQRDTGDTGGDGDTDAGTEQGEARGQILRRGPPGRHLGVASVPGLTTRPPTQMTTGRCSNRHPGAPPMGHRRPRHCAPPRGPGPSSVCTAQPPRQPKAQGLSPSGSGSGPCFLARRVSPGFWGAFMNCDCGRRNLLGPSLGSEWQFWVKPLLARQGCRGARTARRHRDVGEQRPPPGGKRGPGDQLCRQSPTPVPRERELPPGVRPPVIGSQI